jgi:hypothetical protein
MTIVTPADFSCATMPMSVWTTTGASPSEKEFRLGQQRLGDREHLLLPTGHGSRYLAELAGEHREEIEYCVRPFGNAPTVPLERVGAGEEVFGDGQSREHRLAAGDLHDAEQHAVVGCHPVDRCPLEHHSSAHWRSETGDDPEER